MNTLTKRILTAALSASLLAPLATGAQAGGWGDRHGGWGHGRGFERGYDRGYDRGWEDRNRVERGRHEERGRKRNNTDAALAAGVIGLAAGAILLGTMSGGASASTPPPAYYPPAHAPIPAPGPVYGAPIYGAPQASPGYLPWSPAWYDYCSSRYRSFNPRTGTFTTHGGEQRFCQ